MLNFLKTVFGNDISLLPFDCPKKLPYYIRDNYQLQRLSWKDHSCILLFPKSSSWRLPTLKKHLKTLQEMCSEPCALSLENLTSMQRRNLLENTIPFVSLSQQVYLPFWGCIFWEKFKASVPLAEKMAPATQLIFLYFFYLESNEKMNLTMLSKTLRLSKATCTRAVDDLVSSGLVAQEIEGRNKWLTPAFEKKEFLRRGYARLKSPVERLVYTKNLPENLLYLQSGIKALSRITLTSSREQDGGFAVTKKGSTAIPADDVITKQNFEDFGGISIEIWSYDPALLTKGRQVDDISLLLSLEANPDERIQIGLDEIREKYELPIE